MGIFNDYPSTWWAVCLVVGSALGLWASLDEGWTWLTALSSAFLGAGIERLFWTTGGFKRREPRQ